MSFVYVQHLQNKETRSALYCMCSVMVIDPNTHTYKNPFKSSFHFNNGYGKKYRILTNNTRFGEGPKVSTYQCIHFELVYNLQ